MMSNMKLFTRTANTNGFTGWLAVACNFGFRKAELLGLKVRHVNLKDRTIQLLPGTTKNDKGRSVKMTADVYKYLAPALRANNPRLRCLLGKMALP
jgi:integrase